MTGALAVIRRHPKWGLLWLVVAILAITAAVARVHSSWEATVTLSLDPQWTRSNEPLPEQRNDPRNRTGSPAPLEITRVAELAYRVVDSTTFRHAMATRDVSSYRLEFGVGFKGKSAIRLFVPGSTAGQAQERLTTLQNAVLSDLAARRLGVGIIDVDGAATRAETRTVGRPGLADEMRAGAAAALLITGLGLGLALGRTFRAPLRSAVTQPLGSGRAVLRFAKWFIVLAVLVPSRLVIGPLGALGAPANLLGLAGLLWWVADSLKRRPTRAQGLQPTRLAMLAFLGAWLIGCIGGLARVMAPVEHRSLDRSMLFVLSWTGVALVVADGLRTRQQLGALIRFLCSCAMFMAVVALLQFKLGWDYTEWVSRIPGLRVNGDLVPIIARSSFRRVSGTAIHPIEYGVVLAAVLPLAIWAARNRGNRSWTRATLPAIAIALGIPISVSRSALLGLFLGVILVARSISIRERVNAMVGGFFFLGVVFMGVPGLIGTFVSYFTFNDPESSVSSRTSDYDFVARLVAQRPWMGLGPGTFIPERYLLVDNQLLITLAEVGIIGLLGFLAFFAIALDMNRPHGKLRRLKQGMTLERGLFISLVVLFFTSITFDSLSFPMFSSVLALLVGASGTAWRLTTLEQSELIGDVLVADETNYAQAINA